jgi:hypothetical protein
MNFKPLRWVVSLPEHGTAVSGATLPFVRKQHPVTKEYRESISLESGSGKGP